MTDTPTPNPYTGDPAPLSVSAGDTQSEQPVTAPTSPPAAPDINPDVVAQSPTSGPGDEPVAVPQRPSLLDRIRALETRVFGGPHPADDGTD
jgi:hypothetical protein